MNAYYAPGIVKEEAIMQAVAGVFGLSVNDLYSTRRKKDLMTAKRITWLLFGKTLKYNRVIIAAKFKRPYETIRTGQRRIAELALMYDDIRIRLYTVCRLIGVSEETVNGYLK